MARLENVVATLIWTHLHDEFAQRASIVAVREYTRLDPADRAAIEVKRKALLDLVEGIVRDGIASRGASATDEPREAARAIVTLTTSLVGVYAEMDRPSTTSSRSTSGSRSTSQVLRVRDGELDGTAPRVTPSRRRRSAIGGCASSRSTMREHVGGDAGMEREAAGRAGHDVVGEELPHGVEQLACGRASVEPGASGSGSGSGAAPAAFHSSGASSSIRSHSCSATRRPIAASSCERTAPERWAPRLAHAADAPLQRLLDEPPVQRVAVDRAPPARS